MQKIPAIMIVANKNYVIPMFTMLSSLFDNNPYQMEVYLFSSDFDKDTFDITERFFGQWEDKRLIGTSMKDYPLEGLKVTEKLPVEVYYKLLGIEFLPEGLSNILVMDLDMIVKRNIHEIFELDLEGCALAACKDIYAYVYGGAKNDNIRLGLPEEHEYFNGGLIYYNLNYIREKGGAKYLIDMAYKYSDKLKWNEQDLLNLLFYKEYKLLKWNSFNCPPIMYVMKESDVNRGEILPLFQKEADSMEELTGYLDYTEAICSEAAIIHYIDNTKPWNSDRPYARTYEVFDVPYKEYLIRATDIVSNIEQVGTVL